jgi:hypothetical protein
MSSWCEIPILNYDYLLTEAQVNSIIDQLQNGVTFIVDIRIHPRPHKKNLDFLAKVKTCKSTTIIRVTNDERRRIMRVLLLK